MTRPIVIVPITPNAAHPMNLRPEWTAPDGVDWLNRQFRAALRFPYGTALWCTPAGFPATLDFPSVVCGDPIVAARLPALAAMFAGLIRDFPAVDFGWHSGWRAGIGEARKTPSLTRNDDARFFAREHAPLYRMGLRVWSADASSGTPGVLVDHAMNAEAHGHRIIGEAVPLKTDGMPNETYARQAEWWAQASYFKADGGEFRGFDPDRRWKFGPDMTVHKVYAWPSRGRVTPAELFADRAQGLIPGAFADLPDECHRLITAHAGAEVADA